MVIGNLAPKLSAAELNPLSRSTRANSPAKDRSWASPVKNVIDFPQRPPRPRGTAESETPAMYGYEQTHTCPSDPVNVILNC